jgi:hypothetical protein
MQSYALTVDKFLDHAAKWSGDREIVTADAGQSAGRIGYAALRTRRGDAGRPLLHLRHHRPPPRACSTPTAPTTCTPCARCRPTPFALTAATTLLVAVPMFHANGWGLPFAAPAVGAKLVLPGRHRRRQPGQADAQDEGVTVAAGVQTVWLGRARPSRRGRRRAAGPEAGLIGGSSCPDALIRRLEERLGARVQTSWGMTELSPLGTIAAAERAAAPTRAPAGRRWGWT